MWLFGNKKKKEAKRRQQEELEKQIKLEEEKKLEESIIKKEKETAPKPTLTSVKVETKAPVKSTPTKETTKIQEKKSPSGKYEVYPEAGFYKFRLKASNGEILGVSFGYTTAKSAKTGIETFKNAVETGNFEISTDKAGFSHYDLFGTRGARVILLGEFYKTLKLAESAVESVKKFYMTDKIFDLDKIPQSEMREEVVENQKVDQNPNGKFQLIKEDAKSFFIKLVASNGQVLLVSQKYATKQSALNGLEAMQNAIISQNFTIHRDKQNRYQYKLYTANKQLIASGETYPVKQNCLSSIQSVLRFGQQAKLVE